MAKKKAKERVKYNRIKVVLADQDMKVNDLAAKIDKSRVVVSNYINNHKQPSIEILHKISQVLGVSGKDLINF